jgi:hypothetical protein
MAQSKAKTVTSLLILLSVLAFRCQAGYDDLSIVYQSVIPYHSPVARWHFPLEKQNYPVINKLSDDGARADCRARANPGTRDEIIKLYKSFRERSDGKSQVIKRYMDFSLAFRCPILCNEFVTLDNLSRTCAREQGAEC